MASGSAADRANSSNSFKRYLCGIRTMYNLSRSQPRTLQRGCSTKVIDPELENSNAPEGGICSFSSFSGRMIAVTEPRSRLRVPCVVYLPAAQRSAVESHPFANPDQR